MRPIVTGYQGYFQPGRDVVIAAGATDSEAIDTGGMSLVGIVLPSLFTSTALSFLVGSTVDGFYATGQIVFNTAPANLDTLTINGTVITFVTGTPSGNQVQIGGTAALTATALQAFLVASVDAGLLACSYVTSGTVTVVTYRIAGTAGNSIVFDKSSSHITLTPSGGVLSGGGFRSLYDASNAAISMTVAAGRAYAVDPDNFQSIGFLKIRAGTTEVAARTIVLSLKGI